MPKIHLFNPENDLALASGQRNYTPPSNAILLHNAGESLPLWYGNAGDKVIMNDKYLNWVEETTDLFGIDIGIYNTSDNISGYELSPWGWSDNACQQFISAGIPSNIIPEKGKIDKIKDLSHRRTSIRIMTRLKEMLDFKIPATPIEAHTIHDIEKFLQQHPYSFIKLPWSSSGRGITCSTSIPKQELIRRCAGMITRQGSVLCEQGLDKVLDFAMLFHSDGISTVKHCGYSVFFTDNGTAYSGNIVTNERTIENHLSRFIPVEHLHATSTALEEILSEIISPHYTGYMGIDMMIYRMGKEYFIAPCIELNLRMTMGVVAKQLKRFIAPDADALFRIAFSNNIKQHAAPVIENHILVKGNLSLIPEHQAFEISLQISENEKSKLFQFSV